MKYALTTLALVASMSLPAFAQEAPPAGGAPASTDATQSHRPSAQQMAAFQQLHEQMRSIHENARLQMLGSLTAAHRAALANIIGQYAIAPHPNEAATAAQIDALLSSNEKQSVLNAEASARTNSRSLMETARTQMEANMTADQRAKMQARDAKRAAERAQHEQTTQMTPDAGRTLLHVSTMGAGGGPGGHRMGDMGPGPGRPM